TANWHLPLDRRRGRPISFLICSHDRARNSFMASALRKFTPVRRPEAVDDFVVRARIDGDRRHGRGAESNRSGRLQRTERRQFDDGWGTIDFLPPLRTEVQEEKPRKIITTNDSPDISFDRSINPYRGCEHGCSYCFARPTHAYMGLSPGLDFETKL